LYLAGPSPPSFFNTHAAGLTAVSALRAYAGASQGVFSSTIVYCFMIINWFGFGSTCCSSSATLPLLLLHRTCPFTIDNNTLQGEVLKLVGMPYFEEATKDEADKAPIKIRGFTYDSKFDQIFLYVLNIDDHARWVFFIMDPPRSHVL
jgi:hypothetical protein